ncbi:hypothetical protein H0H93_016713 [Arthromyces matolae]|nr:hypothetical protein H0H93_016713 [Arthromyces matolae]
MFAPGDWMPPAVENTRTTRSGAIFSAWQPVLPANPQFSFESQLLESIREESRQLLDIFSLSPLSTPPTSRSSSPSPTHSQAVPVPSPGHVITSLSTSPFIDPPHPKQTTLPDGKRKSPSKKRKDKQKGRERRKRQRVDEAQTTVGATIRSTARAKYIAQSTPIETSVQSEKLEVSSTGYVGLKHHAPRRIFFFQEITGPGMNLRLIKCRDHRPRPFVDHSGRVIALWAGFPSDSSWNKDMARMATLLDDLRRRGTFSNKQKNHSRGTYTLTGVGYAHGGGRTVPSDINPPWGVNYQLVTEMVKDPVFERLAKFLSNVFACWAPRLYQYYLDNMNSVCDSPLELQRAWLGCVFAATIFNLGPQTVTYQHKDHGNLPFGWCAVTALGSYDFTRGGHIILWDLGLVVEFPPSSSMFLPSATLEHSNTGIQPDETRYSITQYTAGALFRWVEHGMQGNREFLQGLSEEELLKIASEDAKRYEFGLSLFSKHSELKSLI